MQMCFELLLSNYTVCDVILGLEVMRLCLTGAVKSVGTVGQA